MSQFPTRAAFSPLQTAVVVSPETGSAGAFIFMDVLAAVGRIWQHLHDETPTPHFAPRLLSLDGKPYRDPHGLQIVPHGALADMPDPDIVVIPELGILPDDPIPESMGPIAEWIRDAHDRGAMVASICSGTLLLSETGLLDGHEATSHWGFCDTIARRHPEIRIRKDRMLVPAGEGHRLITTGGFSSWNDLLLYLIGRLVSPEEARRIAKVFLLDWHVEGQLPFAALNAGRKHDDQIVSDAQLWAADQYREPNPVACMVAQSGLTERSFHRRFKKATGQSPLEYVQTLRIEEAKQALETTDTSFDEIAEDVGYSEPSAFRHLFRRLVGVTPSAYRRRYQRNMAA
ncbi:GlxA family transcriptional regulator [Devosia sp.]|uniref:GlxA family transcriptional regulator n=1 Tax=Devosia sp. TaxID=1871048 RepID=UPI003A8C96C2